MDEEPKAANYWPTKFKIIYTHRVGPKCIVNLIPDDDGMWWEMGGRMKEEAPTAEDTDQDEDDRSQQEDRDSHEDLESLIAQEGGVGIDRSQTRIYYRFNISKKEHECRIVPSIDFYFRRSQIGLKPGRSKSFQIDRMPLPEVLLLYALKTQDLGDRRAAVDAFPDEIWGVETFGQLHGAMDDASSTHHYFCIFAGEMLATSALRPGGLSDWVTWEKVADAAAGTKKEAISRLANTKNQNTHVQLLRALREAVLKCGGLPSQAHVRKIGKWDYNDEWKGLCETLGVRWLPGDREWQRFYKRLSSDPECL